MKYIALSDFEIYYPHPLEVKRGDQVVVGKRDKTWNEWVWISISGEKVGAWMHESMLHFAGDETAEVIEDYSAQEISVKKGDFVESLRELGGWHWSEKTDGTLGWIPDYVLEQVGT